ncbi:hypothetical protein NE237_019231 [Protea cynaroides]|uniref:Uncharacterized protein n=1 Tax=Protea cynaroides TaxID=273540 RepID=A0A9Q0KBF2_9MAGN|nr:hypothetical protein NE237_019231 [Protea cynaroides]
MKNTIRDLKKLENLPPPPSASPLNGKRRSGLSLSSYRSRIVLPAVFAIAVVCDSFLRFWNVAVIKSNKDWRYGLDYVVTHNGVKLPCFALADLSSLTQKNWSQNIMKS